MNVHQFAIIHGMLESITVSLSMIAMRLTPPPGATPAESPWTSIVPAGFDTVLGWLSKNHVDAIDLMYDPVEDTKRDGYWLTHRAAERGLLIIKVPAPVVMQEAGINLINAYPNTLLQERLAA